MKSDTAEVVTGAAIFYHNREIGRGVPDIESVPFSAELWAMAGRAPVCMAPEESTNCEVERPDPMHPVGARPASLVDGLVSLATGVLVALLGPQILLPHFVRYGSSAVAPCPTCAATRSGGSECAGNGTLAQEGHADARP